MYVPKITQRLKRIGVKPLGRKMFSPFKIPWKHAATEITKRYGNIIRVKSEVSATRAASSDFKKIRTKTGAASIPAQTTIAVKNETSVKVAQTNSRVSSRFFPFSKYSLKVGMNATEMLFSAKSLRSKFGIKNAIPKASASEPVPKKRAFVISRTSPSTREIIVRNESFMPEETKFFFIEVFLL